MCTPNHALAPMTVGHGAFIAWMGRKLRTRIVQALTWFTCASSATSTTHIHTHNTRAAHTRGHTRVRRTHVQVPVTILTGFLGSGKTTLLNHILEDTNHGMRFAIIENEFGDVGVDEKILSERAEEELIEVMNGQSIANH